jgi:methionine synthase I (cobalamin-dependent)
MSSRFEERLASGPVVVGDGGMGVLVTSAVPRLRCPEEANLKAPESVVTLHTSFIRAGADLIETNTFGANRRKLAQVFLEDELERINGAGVKLAREAREVAGRDVFIAGSIGPLGDGQGLSPDRRTEIFAEQAAILDGRGVLRAGRARGGDRGRAQRLDAPDRRHADVRRRRRDARRRDRA